MTRDKLRHLWLALGWLGVVAVVVLSLIPQPPELLGVPHEDKVGHLATYGLLMWWFCQALPDRSARMLAGAGLLALGVVLEFVQGWSGLRMFSPADMVADGTGVLFGWLLAAPRTPNLFERAASLAGR